MLLRKDRFHNGVVAACESEKLEWMVRRFSQRSRPLKGNERYQTRKRDDAVSDGKDDHEIDKAPLQSFFA